MHREMLQCGKDMIGIYRRTVALQTLDRSDSHSAGKIWVFAVGLLSASPTWIPRQIHNGHQALMGTSRPRLPSSGIKDAAHECVIPAGSEPNRLGIRSRVGRHKAVQALFMKHQRNS